MYSLWAYKVAILCYTAVVTAFQGHPLESYILPFPQVNSTTTLATSVGSLALDGVFVTQPNATSYEWWYFDAIASDLSASVVVQPVTTYLAKPQLELAIQVSLANGTLISFFVPGDKLFVSTVGDGSNGLASDGSYSWWSRPEIGEYEIEVCLEEQGIEGKIKLQAVAPPHVACGPAVPGASLEQHWDLFWSNIIPDAVAQVDLNLNGTRVSFQGNGYHDKNWGGFSWIPYLNQWYWGHGRAGQWSVVWFYRIDASNGTTASIYIARQGEIVYASCSGVTVRPYGPDATYPLPSATGLNITGFEIEVDAGSLGEFEFVTTATQTVVSDYFGGAYNRWIGSFEGGFVGAEKDQGIALWEQMGPFAA